MRSAFILSSTKIFAWSGAGAFCFLAISGCGVFNPSAQNLSVTEVSAVADESMISDIAKLITEMKHSIGSRQNEQTRTIFSQIQTAWGELKTSVQAKSIFGYEAIEIHLENIETNLNASETDMDLLISDLQLLEAVVHYLPE